MRRDHPLYNQIKTLSDLHTDLSVVAIECNQKSYNQVSMRGELLHIHEQIKKVYDDFIQYLDRYSLKNTHKKDVSLSDHFLQNMKSLFTKARNSLEKSKPLKAKKYILSIQNNIKEIMHLLKKFHA